MPAQLLRSPLRRIAFSLGAVWFIGALIWGLGTGSISKQLNARYSDNVSRECARAGTEPRFGSISNASMCEAARWTTDSPSDKFWNSDPLIVIFCDLLLVPLLLAIGVELVEFWQGRGRSLLNRYLRWLRTGS